MDLDEVRQPVDIHVAATFDAIGPDAGSEYGIGWNWLTQIARHVRQISAVVNHDVLDKLRDDPRAPSNVEFIAPAPAAGGRRILPLPQYYRNYASFHEGASELLADIPADIAHQVTLGTPYWGSAIAKAPGKRLMGPAGISSPIPFRISRGLGLAEWRKEATRTALLRYPLPPVAATSAIRAADYILAVDKRTTALASRLGKQVSPMLQDGANPRPVESLVPVDQRDNLVWAGRMMARKGAPLVVRAFAKALPSLPQSTKLTIFGDGEDMPVVAKLVVEGGLGPRIELAGRVPLTETLEAIQSARALVFSSLRDTFGGVVLEAAERATPCVGALHGGVDGLRQWWPAEAGWFRPARNLDEMVESLAAGMVGAATCDNGEWDNKAQAAYRFAQKHDWRHRGQEMAEIYRRLLSQ